MRARVGSPWFVPKLETRTGSAMPVTLRAVGTQVLRGCVWFVASLLLRCRGRFFWLLRALPHEAGFFHVLSVLWLVLVTTPLGMSWITPVLIVARAQQLLVCGWLVKRIH